MLLEKSRFPQKNIICSVKEKKTPQIYILVYCGEVTPVIVVELHLLLEHLNEIRG